MKDFDDIKMHGTTITITCTLTYIGHFSNIRHSTEPETLNPRALILLYNTMSSIAMLVTNER
jgi:hypothetical protein